MADAMYRLLEGLKIYLTIPNCVFILGMNERILVDAIGEEDPKTGEWKPKRPDPEAMLTTMEPHDRGSILVAAVNPHLLLQHIAEAPGTGLLGWYNANWREEIPTGRIKRRVLPAGVGAEEQMRARQAAVVGEEPPHAGNVGTIIQ